MHSGNGSQHLLPTHHTDYRSHCLQMTLITERTTYSSHCLQIMLLTDHTLHSDEVESPCTPVQKCLSGLEHSHKRVTEAWCPLSMPQHHSGSSPRLATSNRPEALKVPFSILWAFWLIPLAFCLSASPQPQLANLRICGWDPVCSIGWGGSLFHVEMPCCVKTFSGAFSAFWRGCRVRPFWESCPPPPLLNASCM